MMTIKTIIYVGERIFAFLLYLTFLLNSADFYGVCDGFCVVARSFFFWLHVTLTYSLENLWFQWDS